MIRDAETAGTVQGPGKTDKKQKGEEVSWLRLIVLAGLVLVLLFLLFCLALSYVAHHPELMRPLVERAAAASGYRLDFETLDLSFSPPMLEAGNVVLSPLPETVQGQAAMDVSVEKAVFRLDIPGGRKTGIWIEYLELQRPVIVIGMQEGQAAGAEDEASTTSADAWWKYPAMIARLIVNEGDVELTRMVGEKTFSISHFGNIQADIGEVEQAEGSKQDFRTLSFAMSVEHGGKPGLDAVGRHNASLQLSGEADIFADGSLSARVAAGNGTLDLLQDGKALQADFRCAASFSAMGDTLDITESTLAVPRLDLAMPLGETDKDGTLEIKDMALGMWAEGRVDAARNAYTLKNGRIDVRKGKLKAPFGTADLRMKGDFGLEKDIFNITSLSAWMQNLVVVIEEGRKKRRLKLDGAAFQGGGSFDLKNETFSLRKSSLDIGTSLSVQGSAKGSLQDIAEADLQGRVNDAAAVWSLAKPFLPRDMQDISPSGRLPFSIQLSGKGKKPRVKASASPNDFGLIIPAQGLSLRLSGNVDVSGNPDAAMALRSNMGVTGSFKQGAYSLRDIDGRVRLSGSTEAPSIDFFEAVIPSGALKKDGKVVPAGRIALKLGAVSKNAEIWRIEDIDISGKKIGRIQGKVSLNPDKVEEAKADLRLDDVDLSVLSEILEALGVLPEDMPEIGGRTSLKGNIFDEPSLGRRVSLQADFSELGFSTADGLYYLGGLAGRLACSAGLDRTGPFAADISLTAGEALFDTIYLNIGMHALALELQGEIPSTFTDTPPLQNLDARLTAQGLAEVRLSKGYLQPGEEMLVFGGQLAMSKAVPANLVKVFVQDPLSFSMPDLAQLQVDGRADFNCSFSGASQAGNGTEATLFVEGRLELQDMFTSFAPENIVMRDMDLDLPFAYRFGAADAFSAEVQGGRLSIAQLDLPTGTARNIALPVSLEPNRFRMGEALVLPLFGGSLSLSQLMVEEPFSEAFSLSLAAGVRDVDLRQIPMGPVIVEGQISGDFPKIIMSKQRLQAEGELTGNIFGGDLRATGFSVEEPLRTGRISRAESVQVEKMDLEALSTALDIGRITGKLNLAMQNFAYAYGQPLTFSFITQSVDVRGVPKLVSLKAVNSISVIGTGSGLGDAGVGAFASVFKEFNYKSIGVKSTLVNDVFRVQGLIRRGGVEYLIKRPLLFGINVINRNPNNNISFRDMMERIGRVVGRAEENTEESDSTEL
jgi:hypothetical protein